MKYQQGRNEKLLKLISNVELDTKSTSRFEDVIQ